MRRSQHNSSRPVATPTKPPISETGPIITGTPQRPSEDLGRRLTTWVAAGMLSEEQAQRIAGFEGAPLAPAPVPGVAPVKRAEEKTSLVVEALGYLGGAVIIAAFAVLTAMYWGDTALWARLLIPAAAAVVFLVAGAVVPTDRASTRRLGSALWMLAVAATGGFLAELAGDAWDWSGESTLTLVGAGTTALALVLWSRRVVFLQQLVVVVSTCLLAVGLTLMMHGPDSLAGVALWGVGLSWMLLGWGGVVTPKRLVLLCSAFVTIVGMMFAAQTDAGLVLGLVNVAAIITLAVLIGDVILLVLGAFATLDILPMAINTWLPGKLSAPLALFVVGAVLVATALYAARHLRTPAHKEAVLTYGDLPRSTAMTAAGGAAAAVAVVIVVLSL